MKKSVQVSCINVPFNTQKCFFCCMMYSVNKSENGSGLENCDNYDLSRTPGKVRVSSV